MLKLLLFCLAVYGAANAVAVLKVGTPVRNIFGKIPVLGLMVVCPACLSFWLALIVSFFAFSPTRDFCSTPLQAAILDGFIASATSYFFHVTTERLAPLDL